MRGTTCSQLYGPLSPTGDLDLKELSHRLCSLRLISASCVIFASRAAPTLRRVLVPNSSRQLAGVNPQFVLEVLRPPVLSHHLSPGHGVLLVSGVPVSKIVHVSSRVHRRAFGGHADVPQGARGGGGRRRRGEVVSLRSTGPVLHDLLVFGSFVLEPYFHLKDKERESVDTTACWDGKK